MQAIVIQSVNDLFYCLQEKVSIKVFAIDNRAVGQTLLIT